MSTERLFFNGINAADGGYLFPSLSPQDISKVAQGEKLDADHIAELKDRHRRDTVKTLGVKEGVDPTKLEETGWGVIFAHEDKERIPAIKEALGELLELRQKQATKEHGHYYKEYIDAKAYRPGEPKQKFLARHGAGPGPADPDKVPYYLLIVGDPETIPYRFQYQLDVQYAVGRIHFETLEEYAQYARSVVEAETGKVSLPRQATFFGVANSEKDVTHISAHHLVKPLADYLTKDQPDWLVRTVLEDEAKKAQLGQLLGGDETPSFLFTASHGIGFPNGDKDQLRHQGALLCQEWPGRDAWRQAIPHDFYFAAEDVDSDARLLGLMAFFFACYGAGTPQLDYFAHQAFDEREAIAPHAFIAPLPQRLLGHPKGGALAVVGHVERAWSYSFIWERAGEQLTVFESTLKRLIEGHPVGSAMEYFDERYAELSSDLSSELEEIKFDKIPDDSDLAFMWTANNDARSYVIIGDPAVRLPVGENGTSQPRPTISPVKIAAPAPGTPPKTGKQKAEPPSMEERAGSYLPAPSVPTKLKEEDPTLYDAWREHIITGFGQNNVMFSRILNAFMGSYNTTVTMYKILFGVGIASFLVGTVLSVWTKQASFGLAFGGLSAVSFFSYFFSKPLQSLEQNLQFITWLGIVYNTYWTRLLYMMDQSTVQKDLEDTANDTIKQIERLIDKYAEQSGKRPSLK